MQDARIRKTKQKLYQGLSEMLKEKTFEEMTVTDICKKANVTRITFYSYYTDKYSFLHEVMGDIAEKIRACYMDKQKALNPEDDPRKSCHNILNAILDFQESQEGIIAVLGDDNPYLTFSYYWRIVRETGQKSQPYFNKLGLLYPEGMSSIFTITGLVSYIRRQIELGKSISQIREPANNLLDKIIDSGVFTKKEL
ncbi:MAG: TetR/AcrR family transcriptional regulator [Eubacteriales bacterium]|jgi:AcrR family transcriptional regulator